MSEVFYRKWRPRRLDQVVGQDAVMQTLKNAVDQERVAHAYLFCGPRGTGKTSTARILAKAANCLSPQDGEPDNECDICVSINEGRALDLIEIDAASNRGIDDIRNLREKVHFVPNVARHKVYIVDEVHMLTEPAFNALLKTLEEPPRHAIFVLATTEAHKVPLTIVSRCQRFDFRRIPLDATVARLAQLCRDENIEAAPEVLTMIARTSAGSLRDAENLLEQALVSYGSPLVEDQVRDLLELGSDERALELVGHIVFGSVQEGLTVINEVSGDGSDLRQFHRGVMECLRGLLLMKSGSEVPMGYPEETKVHMLSLAEKVSIDHLVHALKALARADVRRDSASPLPLELALVELSLEPEAGAPPPTPAASLIEESLAKSPDAVQSPAGTGPRPQAITRRLPPAKSAEPAVGDRAEESLPPNPSQGLEHQWDAIVRSLRMHKGKRFNLGALLRSSTVREVADGTVTLKYSHPSHKERMQEELDDPQIRKVIQDALATVLGGTYDIRAALVDGQGSDPRQSASKRSHMVRAAQAMGARVVGEKEEEHDEKKDAQAGPAASGEHDEDAGGA